jgi:glutaredoxin
VAAATLDSGGGEGVECAHTASWEESMAVKLHRCSNVWVKIGGHPCWRVQKALDEAGIDYEIVKGPQRKASRDDLERLSGQRKYPVIEFEDGSVYREESAQMAERIRSGHLFDRAGAAGATATAHSHDGNEHAHPHPHPPDAPA